MIQIINYTQRVNLSRDDIKVMILTTLFSKNRYMPTYKKYFKMNFLPIYELIELTKKDDHTALSCLLQSIESEIILHRCCKRIWEEGNQQVPIFTIHDSICTVMEYESFVKEIMIQELSDSIGYIPFMNVSPKLGLISMMDIVSEARKWLVVQFDDESYYLCPEEELINLLNDI